MIPLNIGGLTGLTTIDFPDRLSSVVFLKGCPWRCPYCHNRHLWDAGAGPSMEWREVREFMESRRGLLDGIVFSGGEPLGHPGLADAMREMKSMGFLVALHTAGPLPGELRRLLPLLDWVAMDIKAPFAGYESITRAPGSGEAARRCAEALLESGVPREFRTTWHPRLLGRMDLLQIAETLRGMGAGTFVLQRYRSAPGAPPAPLPEGIEEVFRDTFPEFEVR
jgi:pyruvate formate lyase activating enzyme